MKRAWILSGPFHESLFACGSMERDSGGSYWVWNVMSEILIGLFVFDPLQQEVDEGYGGSSMCFSVAAGWRIGL